LYYLVVMLCSVFDLETVVSILVYLLYCLRLFCLCVAFFLTSFMSDCRMTDLWTYEMIYVCIFLYIFILHAPLLWEILHALVVSYTVIYVHPIILTFLDTSFSSYLLDLYSLLNDRLSVNFLNSLLYLLISVCLVTGQFPDRSTAALSLSLSCSTNSHSYSMWSIVCSPLLQEHTGLSLILYLNRYDLILPCPVTIVVKFGVTLILSFNLSVIFGKNVFVIAPFVVMSHSLCHFVALLSLNSRLTVLFGILV